METGSLMTRLTNFSWEGELERGAQDTPTEGDEGYVRQEEDNELFSESELDEEDEESDDSMQRDLESIGTFGRLRFPSFSWNSQAVSNTQTISRREQLTTFIEDLKSGFSLQSALDRFQTIRSILESQVEQTIENNVDTDNEAEGDLDQESYEPHVIKPAAAPREIPMLDQVIIPQNKEPSIPKRKNKHHHRHRHSHGHTREHQQLATLSDAHKRDEQFLRRRIIQIRQLDIDEESKNRLVQKLMMGAHYDNVKFVDENGDEVFQIDIKTNNQKDEQGAQADQGKDDEDEDDEEEEEDVVIVEDEDKEAIYHDEDEQIMGCPHYQRNCKMECPHCRKWFGCPKCHDEQITDHKFKREKTRHVMCMACFNIQEPTQFCDACDAQFALYFCDECKLYDNDENKDIYHCFDCGICRLGLGLGQDFFHCKGCNACLSIELQNEHRCIERATQSDCPICGEYMFTSTKSVVFMQCGHAIHQSCFDDHSKHSYKCPTCQKTVLNMEAQFRVLDMEISLQPLPEPYCQWTCIVTCNDCNAKSSSPYHVLGLKCDNCKSYNTVQQKLIKPEESDYESDISTTTNQLRSRMNGRSLRNLPLGSHLLGTNYNIENVESDADETFGGDKKAATSEQTTQGKGRTLTIPQQLMNNFDQYLQNMGAESSDDDEEEPLDFLRLNKTLKSSKILSDSGPEDNDVSPSTALRSSTIAETLRGLLARASALDDNDTDEEMNDSDDELNFNGF